MSVFIKIDDCNECPHWDHSGSYTRSGAQPICNHEEATKRGLGKRDPYHWRHRILREDGKIPSWCPLKERKGG